MQTLPGMEPESRLVGTRIGNYRLVRQIGAGGMGAVYEAIHESIGKRVAIKVLRRAVSQDPETQDRFAQEARALTSIEHPGIVQIFDFGQTEDGALYMAMEFLQGESLAARLVRTGPLPQPAALRLGRQIASALSEAHGRGVVHRDLKPENVIIVPDPEAQGGERARVLDFGIAKVFDAPGPVSGTGQAPRRLGTPTKKGLLLGTPAYMSPEQCRGAGTIDERTDVYALGCMIFEMLAGRAPFVAEGEGDLVAMHIYSAPPPLRQFDPAASAEVESYLLRMLAKLPAERPSMAHVAEELLFLGSKGSGALLAYTPPPVVPLLLDPMLRPAASSTSHGAGERVALAGTASWRRPPPALWIVAAVLVLLPALVLVRRRLGPQALAVHEAGVPLSRSTVAPPQPEAISLSNEKRSPEPLAVAISSTLPAPRPRLEGFAPALRREPDAPSRPERPAPPPKPEQPAEPIRKAEKVAAAAPSASPAPPTAGPDLRPALVAVAAPVPMAAPMAAAAAAPPDRPKNVAAAVVRKDKLGGDLPGLPAVLKSHFRGAGPLTLSYKICINRGGNVSGVQAFGAPHAADETVMTALRGWSYRPQPIPLCFIETFTFIID